MTVYAVSNPVYTGLKPSHLYDRATGYGIVRLNKKTRKITIECWPRLSDPSGPDAVQYPGWPITINQTDNYSRKPFGYLPTLEVKDLTNPLVQVIDQKTKETVYTLRIKGNTFQPVVFEDSIYTIKVGTAAGKMTRSVIDLKPVKPKESKKKVTVSF